MGAKDLGRLIDATTRFFELHLREKLSAEPVWASWGFMGSLPDPGGIGCYALFAGDELLYIGSSNDTLANRTNAYTRVAEGGRSVATNIRPYVPTEDWSGRGLDSIGTLSIAAEFWYMVPALEAFLINELKPKFNTHFANRESM